MLINQSRADRQKGMWTAGSSYLHSAGKRNRAGPEQRPLRIHRKLLRADHCESARQQAAGSRLLLEAATASLVREHWKAKDSASHS